MTERHAAQAPALRERLPQIFNFQYEIVNSPPSADPGWVNCKQILIVICQLKIVNSKGF